MDLRPSKRRKIVQEQQIEGTLIQLNYDCLRYVFSYLTVRDMLQMEGIHKRFKDLAQDLYKAQRELDVSKLINIQDPQNMRISPSEAEKIFRRVGPYVETLKLSRDEIDGIKPLRFIWKYCKNLKAVYFKRIDFRHDEYAIKLAPVFTNVTIAHMINCYALTDYRLETMFELHKLKVLMVSNDYGKYDHNGLEGHFLKGLENIEELSLQNSSKLDPYVFLGYFLLNSLLNRTLRSLNINQCSAVIEECLSSIATNLVNLECLNFSIDDFPQDCYLALMDLPKLKDVTIYHHYSYGYVEYDCDIGLLISKLAAHNRLECLSIHFSGIDVTPETWSAIRSFTNLKKLGIRDVDFGPHMELLGMSSANTLEELDVSHTEISNLGLEILVKNLKNIRTIKAKSCPNLTNEFISNIMNHLAERRHKLTIIGWPAYNWGHCDSIPDYNPDVLEFVKD